MITFDIADIEQSLPLLLAELRYEVRAYAERDGVIDLHTAKFAAALSMPPFHRLRLATGEGDFIRLSVIDDAEAAPAQTDEFEQTLDLVFADGYASILIDGRNRLREIDIIRGDAAREYELSAEGTLVPRMFGMVAEVIAHAS